MGLDHPHTKAGVGEFGVAISGGVWVAIRARLVVLIFAPAGGALVGVVASGGQRSRLQ